MFQVTIREMFWLCTIAALALGWAINSRSDQMDQHFLQIQMLEDRLDQANKLVATLQSVVKSQSDSGSKQME